MYLLIITGFSGAGKTHALKKMEDSGFFCVDNLPVALVPALINDLRKNDSIDKVALGIDSRNISLEGFGQMIEACKESGVRVKILFLEASNSVLLRRYNETRRDHPLSRGGNIQEGIDKERQVLSKIYDLADYHLDTSELKPAQLNTAIEEIGLADAQKFLLSVMSFGFKNGSPPGAEILFDVRFLPNPFWIDGLREKTGLDQEVKDYVMSFEQTQLFLDQFVQTLETVLPYYRQEGKNRLNIAIGCTGGCHRSVCIAEELGKRLTAQDRCVTVSHRDLREGQ